MQKRDYYLDFLRGIAVIGVIIIHTAFKSGTSYVPEFMQSITLLLDVPFFFFISGWSYSYVRSIIKNIENLFSIQKRYFVFLILYTTILFLFSREDVSKVNFIYNFFYINTIKSKLLPVVMGSIWFMPVFFSVSFIFSIIIELFEKQNEKKWGIIILFVCIIGLMYTQLEKNFFYLSRNVLFYGFFYMLGFITRDYRIKSIKSFGIILLTIFTGIWILKFIFNIEINVIQKLKFPPHIIYLFMSLISVAFALYGKGRLNVGHKNKFVKIGQNAIFYYFGQGISSSIMYFWVNKINYVWYIKFLIFIFINIFFTILISEILRKIYINLEKILYYIWRKYNKEVLEFFIQKYTN